MDYLALSPQEKLEIYKYYNIDEARIKEDIELIKTWKSKQPHLPDTSTDDFIERILLRNKFRVEQTKQRLDNYYSLRGANKELIQDFDKITFAKESVIFLPLPKLAPNLERIVIAKLTDFDPELHDTAKFIKLNLAVTEILIHYDNSIGVRLLVDCSGFTVNHLTKWNPNLIAKHVTLIEKAYSCRVLGIDLIDFPSFANRILALIKVIVRPKIYERLNIHSDLESVYKVMPKECLPIEYGGTLGNISDLISNHRDPHYAVKLPYYDFVEKWDGIMLNHKEFFVKNYNNVSMEHLRPPESLNCDGFGSEGTFKKLTID